MASKLARADCASCWGYAGSLVILAGAGGGGACATTGAAGRFVGGAGSSGGGIAVARCERFAAWLAIGRLPEIGGAGVGLGRGDGVGLAPKAAIRSFGEIAEGGAATGG